MKVYIEVCENVFGGSFGALDCFVIEVDTEKEAEQIALQAGINLIRSSASIYYSYENYKDMVAGVRYTIYALKDDVTESLKELNFGAQSAQEDEFIRDAFIKQYCAGILIERF